MNETKHDYQNCLVGNFYDSRCTGQYSSWEAFKNTHLHIYNIDQTTLNTEVKEWLKDRYEYLKNLWNEVI